MELSLFTRHSENKWEILPEGKMRVPAVLYADETLIRDMDMKVYEQIRNVAALPGIVTAAYAMPDAHWGYGFPIGGVAAFDADAEGVVSAGGVGFDISCGVRCLHTGVTRSDIESVQKTLADRLYAKIPAGIGSTGKLHLSAKQMEAMLTGGADWAVTRGYGDRRDLERIEEYGCMAEARPEAISDKAKKRQQDEVGTLGSGNHYLEVQHVTAIYAKEVAQAFDLHEGDVVISIHCGSRGLGHQIGTEFLKRMVIAAPKHGIHLPDRELACAPIRSSLGEEYLGAMRAAINCALANRQVLTQLTRDVFAEVLPQANLPLLYDVSHNTCKVETHRVDGKEKKLYVHRKGATRAFGPGHVELPAALRDVGQPVLIGGSMGTASYILVGSQTAEERSFSSACHGAGRAMSRRAAHKKWHGRQLIDDLAIKGVLIRSPSSRGVAEEAPGAYKDVTAVVDATDAAGLARKVARLEPLICIKG
jgi:tRNA-splicing ligase RtcB (3'-phosphate/5'-hydroxy nucleic acid ligase)